MRVRRARRGSRALAARLVGRRCHRCWTRWCSYTPERCVRVRACLCLRACVCVCVCARVRAHVHARARDHARVRVYARVCARVRDMQRATTQRATWRRSFQVTDRAPYIGERASRCHERTIASVMGMEFRDMSGNVRHYKRADVAYAPRPLSGRAAPAA